MTSDLRKALKDLLDGDRLQALAVSANGFAFDPRSGQSFTINHTGIATVEMLVSMGDIDTTIEALAADYEVPPDVVAGAVEVFVRQLARYLA